MWDNKYNSKFATFNKVEAPSIYQQGTNPFSETTEEIPDIMYPEQLIQEETAPQIIIQRRQQTPQTQEQQPQKTPQQKEPEATKEKTTSKESYSTPEVSSSEASSLIKIDIEDLLRSEGITSINGKKIKFGKKELRSSNAKFGVKNSWHKKRDPHTGNASARDISIIGGNMKDYADFKKVLLNNPRIRKYMAAKGWGIINEVTSAALKRTNGTGPHFHFGPDKWAQRTWKTWLNNPDIDVTKLV